MQNLRCITALQSANLEGHHQYKDAKPKLTKKKLRKPLLCIVEALRVGEKARSRKTLLKYFQDWMTG
jgi:hypothetical protein